MFVLKRLVIQFIRLLSERTTNVLCKKIANGLTYSCCFIQITRFVFPSLLPAMIVLPSLGPKSLKRLQMCVSASYLQINVEL